MRKPPPKKRATRLSRPPSNVDPSRMAVAAVSRIEEALSRAGIAFRMEAPPSRADVSALETELGVPLPPSFAAALAVIGQIGPPERFLSAREVASESSRLIEIRGDEAQRYAPFCRRGESLVCFDKSSDGVELPVVEWGDDGHAIPLATHFGEWLDLVADERETTIAQAAELPPRLKRLLYELGFRFDAPLVGYVDTGDTGAVSDLFGAERAESLRDSDGLLLGESGKARLTLYVDDFTMRADVGAGTFRFEPEHVFRWLRSFRDENFFSDVVAVASHPDVVRDLRRAAAEAPQARPMVLSLPLASASRVAFRTASGNDGDFVLLGQDVDAPDSGPSFLLRVVDDVVQGTHVVEDFVVDIHVTTDGTIWALTETQVLVVVHGVVRRVSLRGMSSRWYGIGEHLGAILVWGRGTIVRYDGHGFTRFAPSPELERSEAVVAVRAFGARLWALVCGPGFGAVARYDGHRWLPIGTSDIVDAELVELDATPDTAHVVDVFGRIFVVRAGQPPALVRRSSRVFFERSGQRRSFRAVVADGAKLLLGADDGIFVDDGEEPTLFPLPIPEWGVRFRRLQQKSVLGSRPSASRAEASSPVVILNGPAAWILRNGDVSVIETEDW